MLKVQVKFGWLSHWKGLLWKSSPGKIHSAEIFRAFVPTLVRILS